MEGKKNAAVRWLCALAVLAAFAVFALCAAAGLVMTCSIDPEVYWNETILYKIDNIAVNLAVLAAVTAAGVYLFGIRKVVPRERTVTAVSAVSLAATFALGVVWVALVKCVPEFDSHYVSRAAAMASRNDWTGFGGLAEALTYARELVPTETDYFVRFPFQLGFVTILEGLQRLFGAENWVALGCVNAACLTLGYAALLDCAKTLYADTRVRLVTALLPLLFLQGPLFCTFVYGNLFGFGFMMVAVALFLRWMKGARAAVLIPAALCAALAVLAKPNYWIFVVALGIVALLHCIRTKKFAGLAMVLVAVVLGTGGLRLCTARYEQKAGTTFGAGTPQSAWLAMGMHGSYMAPGWYNGYTSHIFRDADYEPRKAKELIASDLGENLSKMKNPVYAAAFFGRKFLSQFEETSFESVFVSKDAQNGRPVPELVSWVYGRGEQGLLRYFDQVMQLVYVFAAWALWKLFRTMSKRPAPGAEPQGPDAPPAALLPVILLGGFLYHMLFEGKSQYILVYIPLLFPFAGAGFIAAADALAQKREKRREGRSSRKAQ
ncbi:MAG: hypothetical protein Q4C53_03900 [Clostridia bacterium]|nr:hypothetical protein [Clostridia bacterium]